MTTGPLSGITILDLSRVLSGPYCTMLAADMGARVIKIEHPVRGDDTRAWGPPFLAARERVLPERQSQQGKRRGRFQDARGPRHRRRDSPRRPMCWSRISGRARSIRLASATTELAAQHPRLIYVSISGFGQNGPRRDEAGYDAVAQAEGGLMSITGAEDGPAVRLGVGDRRHRRRACLRFRACCWRSSRAARPGAASAWTSACSTPSRRCSPIRPAAISRRATRPGGTGNRHASIAPYDTFDTADGVLVLAVGNDSQWQSFCRVVRAPDARRRRALSHERRPRRALRGAASRRWQPLVRAWPLDCARRRAARRRRALRRRAVRSIEALADPQIAARAMVETLDHPTIGALKTLGLPVKLSETPGRIRTAPPPTRRTHARACSAGFGNVAANVDRTTDGSTGNSRSDRLRQATGSAEVRKRR